MDVPMCECCGGECKLCERPRGFLRFPEPITKMYIREVIDKDGCRIEEIIVNNKWKMIPTGDPKKPFKKKKLKS